MSIQKVYIVQCNLCKSSFHDFECLDHLSVCVKRFRNSDKIPSKNYYKYFILSYILDIEKVFDNRVNVYEKKLYNIIFQIYSHFYFDSVNELFKSPLLGLDDFSRVCLTRIVNPKDIFLNVIPGLLYDDFIDDTKIIDLKTIFSLHQIQSLKYGSTFSANHRRAHYLS